MVQRLGFVCAISSSFLQLSAFFLHFFAKFLEKTSSEFPQVFCKKLRLIVGEEVGSLGGEISAKVEQKVARFEGKNRKISQFSLCFVSLLSPPNPNKLA